MLKNLENIKELLHEKKNIGGKPKYQTCMKTNTELSKSFKAL